MLDHLRWLAVASFTLVFFTVGIEYSWPIVFSLGLAGYLRKPVAERKRLPAADPAQR